MGDLHPRFGSFAAMGRHPLASLPLSLLLLTFGCAGVSLSRAAIVTINDSESGIQHASLGRRGRSSALSSHTKSSLAPASSTTTTSPSVGSSPTASSAVPGSTGLMISTTSRNAAPTSGPQVSSPTTVPNAIIGVAVAGFVLLLVVGGGWWWWWRRHRRAQRRATTMSLGTSAILLPQCNASPSPNGYELPQQVPEEQRSRALASQRSPRANHARSRCDATPSSPSPRRPTRRPCTPPQSPPSSSAQAIPYASRRPQYEKSSSPRSAAPATSPYCKNTMRSSTSRRACAPRRCSPRSYRSSPRSSCAALPARYTRPLAHRLAREGTMESTIPYLL